MGEATFPKSVSNATVAPSSDATIEPLPDPEKSQDLEASEDRLPDADDDDSKYPGARIVIPILGALYITMFLVALDRIIIATAIPRITDDFHSIGDVGWYASSYMLAACALQLVFGKIYTFYSPKAVLLVAIAIFEVGSALCGAAPSSTAFIVGRAIAGCGSAGIFTGIITSTVHIIPLHRRPMVQGFFGSLFAFASVGGPLIGGVLVDKASWRWCFYINLPIGAVVAVVLVLILKLPIPENTGVTLTQKISKLDPPGNLCLIPGVVCLLLALQWGGSVYAWNNGRIIALLLLAAVLLISFVCVQIWRQESGTVPPRIAKQRSIASAMVYSFCSGSAMMVIVYNMPIWFQAIKGDSAVQSGIDTLPLLLALVVATISSGGLTTKIGYYTPAMIVSPIIMSIGAGLCTTFKPDTGSPVWIGYQIIFGFGLGCAMQVPNLAAQCVLAKRDVPTGVSLMIFMQMMGGAVFVSVAENVFTNRLTTNIGEVSGIAPAIVLDTGATELRSAIPKALLPAVLLAYNNAITSTFIVGTVIAAVAIIPALTMEWKSVKRFKGKKPGPKENEPAETLTEKAEPASAASNDSDDTKS